MRKSIVALAALILTIGVIQSTSRVQNSDTYRHLILSKVINSTYEVQTWMDVPQLGQVQRSSATGFATEKGIITCYHVVRNADHLVVRDNRGREYVARIVKTDPLNDLALLSIDRELSTYLTFSDSAPLIGEEIYVVGNPLGMRFSISKGIVSAFGRKITLGPNTIGGLLQIDAPANRGNSGSPVVRSDGTVVGMANASASVDGIGFAVSSLAIRFFLGREDAK